MTLTPDAQAAIRSDAIGDPYIVLLRIETADITIAITDDADAVTWDGVVYQPWPFRFRLGAAGADRQPSASVEISNVAQAIASALRSVSDPPTCDIRVARMGPDLIPITYDGDPVTYLGEPLTAPGLRSNGYAPRAIERELLGLRIVAVEFALPTAVCRLGPEFDFGKEKFPPWRHDGRFVGLWS